MRFLLLLVVYSASSNPIGTTNTIIKLESLLTLKGRVFGGSLTLTGKKMPNREISSIGWNVWVIGGKYFTYYNW
jgi:hypothetical protein